MKIFVTGATGFIGLHLVPKLLQNGHEVTVIARNPDKCKEFNCTIIQGDLLDKELISNSLPGHHMVIHLAGSKEENAALTQLMEANVTATKNVLEASIANTINQFIFTSTIGVLGPSPKDGRPVTEDAPYNPQTNYEKTKCEAEKYVVSQMGHINISILRPTMIYGPEDIWLKVFKKARQGFPIIGNGQNHWHLVYINDAVDAIYACINNPKAYGQIFNIADNQPEKYMQVYAELRHALGLPPVKKHIPLIGANTLALISEAVSKIARTRPILTRAYIKRLTRQRLIDTSKAKQLLGYDPHYTNASGFKETVAIFRQKGLL